jgi:S1-C subfamily serine protease
MSIKRIGLFSCILIVAYLKMWITFFDDGGAVLSPASVKASALQSVTQTPGTTPSSKSAKPLTTASSKVTSHPTMSSSATDAPAAVGHVLAPQDLFKAVSPSVVRIISMDKKGQPIAQGSGFVANDNGLVVTNYHVVKGASSLSILLDGGKAVEVMGVASVDPDGDLALIKAKGMLPPPLKLAATLSLVGARTYAIGSPLGLTNTLSEGLVSGLRKENVSLTFIQTTAPISPGSSGGPLLDESGEVLGVTTLCFIAGQNLNFAVESARIRRLIESYGGGLTKPNEQAWVPTRFERSSASTWLTRAAKEAAQVRVGRERIWQAIAHHFATIGERTDCLRALEAWRESISNGGVSWYQEAEAAAVLAELGDPPAALAVLDASPNIRTRVYGYVFVANALHTSGDFKGYERCMATAFQQAQSQSDPIIRSDTLVLIVKGYADANHFEMAKEACAALTDTDDPNRDAKGAPTGFRRNGKSVGKAHIGMALAKGGDFAAAAAIAEGIFDRTDQAFLMLNVVERAAQAGKFDLAGDFCKRIRLTDYRALALLAVAAARIDKGDRTGGRDAIHEAFGLAKNISDPQRRGQFNFTLAGVLADGGEFDSAQRIASGASEREHGRATARIAVALAKRGDYSQAMKSLSAMRRPLDAIPAYNRIAVLQAENGHFQAAFDTAGHIPFAPARVEALRGIVKAAARKDYVEELGSAIGRFKTADERAYAYLGLAEGIIGKPEGNLAAAH